MVLDAPKQSSLLYVSNQGARDVTVYAYSDGGGLNLVGTLTGFLKPSGMCTDKSGDVLITDSDARRVYRYHHGGTKRVAIIQERGSSVLFSCAVDPTTGDVATADQFNGDGKPVGLVKIYTDGERNGKKYYVGKILPYYLAYDDKGNLFVDAQNAYNHNVSLLEMTKGDSYFVRLTVAGGALNSPSAIQWIKPTLLMGNETSDSVAPFADKLFISGQTATIVGQVPFPSSQQAAGFYRRAGRIVVPDPVANEVEIYTFPGGALYSTLTQAISNPVSVVVSQAGSGS
jgi:hypothetical protein